MKEKIVKKSFGISFLLIIIGFILTFIIIIKPTIFDSKIKNNIIMANDILLVILLVILYIANKNEINLLTEREKKNAVILSIFASILYSTPMFFDSGFELEFGMNIIYLLLNKYTILAILLHCFATVKDKKITKGKSSNLNKVKSEEEILAIKKSNKKYKIIALIGLSPLIIITVYSIISFFHGSTFLGQTTKGMGAFLETFIIYTALAYPIVMFGLFVSIYALMKIKKILK